MCAVKAVILSDNNKKMREETIVFVRAMIEHGEVAPSLVVQHGLIMTLCLT